MTRVTRYTDVLMINARKQQTRASRSLYKQIGLCIAQGGHVEMKTYQSEHLGTERADAALYWKEEPHAALKRHRRSARRAND